jgi:hypothetical protein
MTVAGFVVLSMKVLGSNMFYCIVYTIKNMVEAVRVKDNRVSQG